MTLKVTRKQQRGITKGDCNAALPGCHNIETRILVASCVDTLAQLTQHLTLETSLNTVFD